MPATITPIRPPATPDTPPAFDFTAHARLLVETFGYKAEDVKRLCPRATGQVQDALAAAMAAVQAGNA